MPHTIQQNAAPSPAAVPDAQQCQKKTNSLSPAQASTPQNALKWNNVCCEAVIFHCYQLLLKNWKTYLNVALFLKSSHKIPMAHKLPFLFSSQKEICIFKCKWLTFRSFWYLLIKILFPFHNEKESTPIHIWNTCRCTQDHPESSPPNRLINILNYTSKETLERSVRGA